MLLGTKYNLVTVVAIVAVVHGSVLSIHRIIDSPICFLVVFSRNPSVRYVAQLFELIVKI